MMNSGAFGQFQRGNSCSQGRGQTTCAQPQPRLATPCNQSQSRPSAPCSQPQSRPSAPCNQPQSRPSAPCNQPQPRPSASCSQQPQPRPATPCNQPQGHSSHRPAGPSCPCSEMNREQLFRWISLTKFACVDSSLYLDTHPCDVEAIAYFKEHVHLYNEALAEYSKTYGPLTLAHAHHCDTYWDWVNQPWPWQ